MSISFDYTNGIITYEETVDRLMSSAYFNEAMRTFCWMQEWEGIIIITVR